MSRWGPCEKDRATEVNPLTSDHAQCRGPIIEHGNSTCATSRLIPSEPQDRSIPRVNVSIRCRSRCCDLLVLLNRACGDPDGAHDMAIADQGNAAGEDRQTPAVGIA